MANIPYDIQLKNEKYYQSLFYVTFMALGYTIEAEARTNCGRMDAVLVAGDYVYILEFKLNGSKEKALSQIKEREYYQKYQNSGKKIILIGASVDYEARALVDWVVEQ